MSMCVVNLIFRSRSRRTKFHIHLQFEKYILHLSNAGSLRLLQRSLSAYFSILSLASVLTTLNPSSTSIIESTLHSDQSTSIYEQAYEC